MFCSNMFSNSFYCLCLLEHIIKFFLKFMLAQAYLSVISFVHSFPSMYSLLCVYLIINCNPFLYLMIAQVHISMSFLHACSSMYFLLCLYSLKHRSKLIPSLDACSTISSNSFSYLLKHISKHAKEYHEE